ncbi:MAG: hypothetical protein ACRC2T_09865 [Thermoguttaceae bacterium]
MIKKNIQSNHVLRITALLLVLTVSFVLSGCSKSPYNLAPATGIVTLDGEPIEALVNFFPVGEARGAIGHADASGKFSLGTLKAGDGAVVGKHRVAVSPKTPPPMSGSAQMLGSEGTGNYVAPFPERYSNPATSGIEVEVVKGGKDKNYFELKLESK